METTQSAKESSHTNAENHKKEERKENGLATFLAEKLATPMRDFVYLCPNNLMRSALHPTGKSSHEQNETSATNCRTARCNLIILTMQNKEIHTSGAHKRPHQPKVSGKFLLLDTRLLNSPDLFRLRETMGMEGWGMALFVLNYLLEHGEWGRAPLHAVTDLARMCHKNKRSMMALLTDYPTLFEIEAGGKVFNSPYLRQCLGGEKIKINQKSCGLETLTNEPSDNQALSLHRIKDERIKKKNDEEKETTAADAADAVAKKAEKDAKQPAVSGTKEVKVVDHPTTSGTKQPGFRLETVFTDLAQAARKLPDDERQPLRTTWEILAQLYTDSLYWQSLERLVGLEVYSQERWKRLALRWFFTYCVTQAKPIAALNDAKSYLNHLLQPGRNTRQAFEHYAQTQYEADCRAWQHYRQMQENVVASGSNDVSKP